MLCCLKTFLNVLVNSAYRALNYSPFHSGGKLRQYKGKVKDGILLENADKVVLNIINKRVAHTLKESLFYGLHEATPFSWHAQKGNATVSAAHPPTELQKSHSMGMGAPSYLQFKGTALSQKFNIITGDVFLSEKWAIQSSAGEKRWLKRGKKKMEKKAKIVEIICVLVYHSCCIYPSAFKNIWDSILK